jgi:hypothetical protein
MSGIVSQVLDPGPPLAAAIFPFARKAGEGRGHGDDGARGRVGVSKSDRIAK